MKYLILIMDGAADYPCEKLGWKTPLQVAEKPNIDKLAKKGKCGLLKTIPENFATGSVVANLSILGYDPLKYYKGRGVLEAAALGIDIGEKDVAFRCNLINIEEDKINSHSAGNLQKEETCQIIETLNKRFGNERIVFFPGLNYRNILVLKEKYSEKVKCFPPHDYIGSSFLSLLPQPVEDEARETAELLKEMILKSREILEKHPVNLKREREGKMKANLIWPWSPGKRPKMETFRERFGIEGGVISGVDLIKGLGIYCGLKVIHVEGATGDFNTNYEGKAEKAVKSLERLDFVYVHVEAPDEAGHEGNLELKIKCIEDFDRRLVGNILNELDLSETSIAVMPDHYTPVSIRKHTTEPVPFLIYRPDEHPDRVEQFDEISCKDGFYGTLEGRFFIHEFLRV